MGKRPRGVLLAGMATAVLVVALQWVAIQGQSLVGDAPYHLLAGHQALRYGTNTLNLEHPPLVKLVAGLPTLAERVLAPPSSVDGVLARSLRLFDDPGMAARVRIRSRVLVLAFFGLPFLAAAYLLGRVAADERTGLVLAAMLGLSLPVLPNLAILQTDTAVALGFTLTAALSLLYMQRQDARTAAALGLSAGLCLVAKFSGLLAGPTVALALVLAPGRNWRQRLGHTALVGGISLLVLGASYGVANRDYDEDAGRDAIRRYCRGEALIVDHEMRDWEERLLAVERFSPGAAQYLTGLVGVRIQNDIGVYPSYAFGDVRSTGRWWYFPAVLLVRTPLAILAALILALGARASRPPVGEADAVASKAGGTPALPAFLLAATAAIYLLVSMTSSYNLGIRHLLPILPILYLPAAAWTAARPRRTLLVVGFLAVESLAVAPLWMSATNTWFLGAANPTRFAFSTGDTEYRQNFLALDDARRRRGIEKLHVLYPLIDERELRASVPGASLARPGAALEPGWYAVNVMVEQYVPALLEAEPTTLRGHAGLTALAKRWRSLWEDVRQGEDHGYVAGTFHLYRRR